MVGAVDLRTRWIGTVRSWTKETSNRNILVQIERIKRVNSICCFIIFKFMETTTRILTCVETEKALISLIDPFLK